MYIHAASEPLECVYHINMHQRNIECHSSYREPLGLDGAVVLNLIDQLAIKYPNMIFLYILTIILHQ